MKRIFMNTNLKKSICVAISVLIIALACASGLKNCFEITWRPRENLYWFYRLEDNSLDMINIGSSHIYCSINTVELYRKEGITSYNLAAGAQPIWFSYYYLKEALKTQNPKVVVLDVYTMYETDDKKFGDYVQGNLLTLKPSLEKWEAIKISDSEEKWNLFWGFPKIHARYREVTAEEYCENACRNMMGYAYLPSSVPKENGEVLDADLVKEVRPVSKKAEDYLRKCIELCQSENIKIVLVNSPWADVTYDAACRYNYIQKIANEYKVDFLDGTKIYKDIGINYLKDNAEGGHLSYTGSLKWTEYLAKYLIEHCNLSDHRGEYSVWEEATEVLDNLLEVEELRKTTNAEEYFRYLTEETQLPYVAIVQSEHEIEGTGLELEGEEMGYILRTPDGKVQIRTGLYSDKRLYKAIYDDLQEGVKEKYNNILMQYTEKIADSRTTNGICYVVFDPFSYEPLDIVELGE